MKLQVPGKTSNESFVRATVGAFASQLDLSLEEMADIKTAVSEAVTNAIIHGYECQKGVVTVECKIIGEELEIKVIDQGVGIENVELAMQPLYTSKPDEERSGMGFTVMQTFMDRLVVESALGEGTKITMTKRVANG